MLGKDPGPKSTFQPPKKQTHVHGIYDVEAALAPYINPDIHFYQVSVQNLTLVSTVYTKLLLHKQIPHEFIFYMHAGRCIMQYKHFDGDTVYMPAIPNDLIAPSDGNASDIRLDYYQAIGGQDEYASLVAGGTVTYNGNDLKLI